MNLIKNKGAQLRKLIEVLYAFFKKDTVFCVASLAALLSAFWVTPSANYFSYIDYRVLGLLFCLMIVVAGLHSVGLFDRLANWLLRYIHTTRQLISLLVFICFFMSMWITNDVALITFVPFAVMILHRTGQDKRLISVIVMQTIAANLGSMCTPIGNPQNLYLYTTSGMSIGHFFAVMFPLSLFSLVLLILTMLLYPRKSLAIKDASTPSISRPASGKKCFIYVILLLLCLLTVFRLVDYRITLVVVLVTITLMEMRLLLQADYVLLLTFVAFFIFVGNIRQVPVVDAFLQHIILRKEVPVSILASQFISNVPAAVLLSGFTKDWAALLTGTNLGGLGTLIASMASLISYKYYCATSNCKPGAYLGFFTLANLVYLGALVVFWWLLQLV